MPEVADVGLAVRVEALALPRFERPWYAGVREARLLTAAPWARSLGKLPLVVSTVGWRFPAPPAEVAAAPKLYEPDDDDPPSAEPPEDAPSEKKPTRLKPPGEMVVLKDRLLYLLQPPLENLFAGRPI